MHRNWRCLISRFYLSLGPLKGVTHCIFFLIQIAAVRPSLARAFLKVTLGLLLRRRAPGGPMSTGFSGLTSRIQTRRIRSTMCNLSHGPSVSCSFWTVFTNWKKARGIIIRAEALPKGFRFLPWTDSRSWSSLRPSI